MNTLIEETMLMRQSKADVVAELQRIFPRHNITEATPLSDIAKYMQWAVGFLSIDLATVNVNTDEQAFFTAEEWNALTSNQKANYIKCGVRLRSEGQEFIISKSAPAATTWGPTNIDVDGLPSYEGAPGMLDDFEGARNTETIMATSRQTGQTFGAAAACSQYKSCTLAQDGYEDKQTWYLPSVAEMDLINKHIDAINAELQRYYFDVFAFSDYWTSTECNSLQAWRYIIGSGVVRSDYFSGCGKHTGNGTLRPCGVVSSPAI